MRQSLAWRSGSNCNFVGRSARPLCRNNSKYDQDHDHNHDNQEHDNDDKKDDEDLTICRVANELWRKDSVDVQIAWEKKKEINHLTKRFATNRNLQG